MIDKPELKVREFYRYKAYYCGLCRTLKEEYGFRGRMTLTYDMTFLIILLSSLYETENREFPSHCPLHPVKKIPVIQNDIGEYGAKMNILLTYFKFEDDWKDEKNWIKSNPNLDVTVKSSYLKKEVRKAINTPSDEVNVKTKNLNMWCDSSDVWIPDDYILSCSEAVDLSAFSSRNDCFCGIDLSSTSDLTAVSFMVPSDGKAYFKTFYYLPEEALQTKRNKEQYGEWVRNGYLTITPGNVVDYDYILDEILRVDKQMYIFKVGYDAWNATQFVINATDKGLPMEPVSQSIGNFNRPTKEMERIILSGKAVIDNNPITRFCFRNVVMKIDYNGNTKPTKEYKDKKIDGVISMIEALGVYLLTPQYSDSI